MALPTRGMTTNTWNSAHWTPGPVAGPTANTDSATINGGQVTINGQNIDSAIFIGSGATVVANAQDLFGNVGLVETSPAPAP